MKKSYLIAAAVLLVSFLLIGLSAFRFAGVITKEAPKDYDTKEGVSYLQSLASGDARAQEDALRATTVTTAAASATPSDGNFRAAFKHTFIAGDSLIKAITEYRILDTTNVCGEVSAGVRHLEENTGKIAAYNPRVIILHYGENALDHKERAPYFIRDYKAAIQNLQRRVPNAAIYVDSIWPVQEKAHKTEPLTVHIDYYNGLLREMCKDIGVTFLDYDPLFRSFTENYYDPDGIHPKYRFYKEQYLPFLEKEALR